MTHQPGTKFFHSGFGNFIAIDQVVAIVTPGSAPVQRLIKGAKKKGNVLDMTSGHRIKAVVITDTDEIILLAITPESATTRSDEGTGWIDLNQSRSPENVGWQGAWLRARTRGQMQKTDQCLDPLTPWLLWSSRGICSDCGRGNLLGMAMG